MSIPLTQDQIDQLFCVVHREWLNENERRRSDKQRLNTFAELLDTLAPAASGDPWKVASPLDLKKLGRAGRKNDKFKRTKAQP